MCVVAWLGPDALAAPWGDLPADPVAARATVTQDVLPALEARAEVARRQVAAREAWFAGETDFGAAFPGLVGASLAGRAVLDGRLVLLDDAAEARARDRATPLPDVGDAASPAGRTARDALASAVGDALDAEDAADALERRLLLSLRAFAGPDSPAAALDAVAADLREVVAEAQAAAEVASDADRPDRARRAALLDDELRRTEALALAVRVRVTVPASPPPPIDDDLARADDPVVGPWAVRRLQAVAPLLDADDRARLATAAAAALEVELPALEAEIAAVQAAPVAPPVDAAAADALSADVARLQDEVATAVSAQAVLTEGVALDVARARTRLAIARRDAAAASLAAWTSRQGTASTAAERARTEAVSAAAAAASARESAGSQEAVRTADLQTAEAEASRRAAEAWEEADAAETARQAAAAARTATIADLDARTRAITARGLLGTEEDPDTAYRELRALQRRTRLEVLDAGHAVVSATAAADAAAARVRTERAAAVAARSAPPVDPSLRATALATAARWEVVLDDELAARAAVVGTATGARDDALHALQQVRELRRVLVREVSAEERVADRGEMFSDAALEVRLLSPTLVVLVRDRIASLLGLPARMLDFNELSAMAQGSLWLLGLGAAWYLARARVDRAADLVLPRVAAALPEVAGRDVAPMRPAVVRALRAVLDLVAGLLLLDPVGQLAGELWVVLFWWVHVAGYRALLATFDLLVVRWPDARPGLAVLAGPVFDLARTTVRLWLVWFIARRFAVHMLAEVLSLYTITAMVRFAFTVAAIGLAGWLLQRWEPHLRSRMAQRHQGTWLVRTLSREPAHRALFAVHSVAILGYTAVAALLDLVNRQASEREGIGRLVNVFNRYRLIERQTASPPLPSEVAARVLAAVAGPDGVVARESELAALDAAFAAWESERRRGLVMVTGDRGEGKTTLVGAFAANHDAVVLRVPERLLTEAAVYAWLAGALGVDGTSRDGLVAALQAAPSRRVVLEDAHRCFLRTVDGFDGLRALLYVLNATADAHFWLLTAHRPAWRYLSRLGSLVNVEVFRAVVELEALGERRLRQLVLARTASAGLQPSFAGLVRPSPFGADPATELERTIATFFRLLAEASAGNPSVALRLWVRCLTPGEGADEVRVWMHECLGAATVGALSEVDLFTLVALRTQDVLDEAELVAVTNLGAGVVRSTVKHLQQRGLLATVDEGVHIALAELAAVTRTLRRRHFVQSS